MHPTGYQRIAGELRGLGLAVSATTVRTLLREAGLGPAGERARLSWREFLRTQAHSMIAADFLTIETVWLERLYVLFFIELGSWRVHLAGCTANPSGTCGRAISATPLTTGCHASPRAPGKRLTPVWVRHRSPSAVAAT
jgi:hypothetical protein